MEREDFTHNEEREAFIKSIYEDKKGREVLAQNPYTMYININSMYPNLPLLTASLFENLIRSPSEAKVWASRWDKSIITVAPSGKAYCDFLHGGDSKGKSYIPVSTTGLIDSSVIVAPMPKVDGSFIAINDQPTTTDAFLISYFHMVNELIWDKAIEIGRGNVSVESYQNSLKKITDYGFSVGLVNEADIIKAKNMDPKVSVRIYGSKVNPFVPQIMGAILKT